MPEALHVYVCFGSGCRIASNDRRRTRARAPPQALASSSMGIPCRGPRRRARITLRHPLTAPPWPPSATPARLRPQGATAAAVCGRSLSRVVLGCSYALELRRNVWLITIPMPGDLTLHCAPMLELTCATMADGSSDNCKHRCGAVMASSMRAAWRRHPSRPRAANVDMHNIHDDNDNRDAPRIKSKCLTDDEENDTANAEDRPHHRCLPVRRVHRPTRAQGSNSARSGEAARCTSACVSQRCPTSLRSLPRQPPTATPL